jgi:hypothetical protein
MIRINKIIIKDCNIEIEDSELLQCYREALNRHFKTNNVLFSYEESENKTKK